MPELPDITVYVDALTPRVVGRVLSGVHVRSAFLVRSVEPALESVQGRRVERVGRLGKRLVLGLEGEVYVVLHLMIAGRLLWKALGTRPKGKVEVAAFDFEGEARDGAAGGTLVLYEAGTQKRASLHVVAGREALRAMDPGGIDVFTSSEATFGAAVRRENHTIKRVLTDPRVVDGIGNAYSDEILHAARMSPLKLTASLSDEEASRVLVAARRTLERWTEELRREFGIGARGVERRILVDDWGASAGEASAIGRFPGKGDITAFRPGFAVHGKFGKPCPVCRSPVQRIVYAENETNYCATCQTGGKVLADRSLSRLLKDDWPRRIEEVEG